MSGNRGNDSGAGCAAWAIGILLAIAAVIYGVSALGHALGLTPTGEEVLDSEDGFLTAHYEGVAVGYVLTVLVMLLVVGGFLLWLWARQNQPDNQQNILLGIAGIGAVLAILTITLPAGEREEALTLRGSNGPASSGPTVAQLAERRQERRQEVRQRARERRAARLAQQRRVERRKEARQQAKAKQAAPPPQEAPAPDCDPSYSGACLDPYASDYDCEGGDGDGPKYTGPVTVVGDDHYELDTGDGDPAACEPY